ncbi:MAG TPA: hypothetical protein VK932_03225, partial [Kofleriaceae bacterium]|nr:hypothetical protein [Kofleriaceae bacterium]
MTKKRRPGTRGGGRGRLPSDIADAAEAALDDMLQRAPESGDDDEPKTQTRSPSHEVPVAAIDDGDEEMQTVDAHRVEPPSDDTAAVTGRRSKIPLPAPPRTTSVHTLGSLVPRESPPPSTPPPRASPPLGSRAATPPVSRPATPVSRATPTPPLVRGSPAVSSPQTPTPTPVIPRPRTAVNLGHSPQTPLEPTTADLGPLEGSFDQTARLPPDLPLDLDGLDGADIPDPDELVPVRPELASLQVAVYEDAAHLASAQGAIVAAGHVVDVGASGRDGIGRVLAAVRGGSIDVVLVALPGGEAIVEAALALEPRRPIVIASFAGRAIDAVARAHAAGADLAVARPHDV